MPPIVGALHGLVSTFSPKFMGQNVQHIANWNFIANKYNPPVNKKENNQPVRPSQKHIAKWKGRIKIKVYVIETNNSITLFQYNSIQIIYADQWTGQKKEIQQTTNLEVLPGNKIYLMDIRYSTWHHVLIHRFRATTRSWDGFKQLLDLWGTSCKWSTPKIVPWILLNKKKYWVEKTLNGMKIASA